jgi:phage tail sheath protein FI
VEILAEFRTEAGVQGTDYEKVFARKFTFAPYGGFDGWDVYRTRRTNLNKYTINGTGGIAGGPNGTNVFANRALTNGDNGLTSDYYAYLEAIRTFDNPEAVNINVFSTPGINTFDNSSLVEETIEMVEQDRADSFYIVTTPDTDASGDVLLVDDVVDTLDGQFDSSYTATYWPWVQINDDENGVFIYVPPTRDVVRNIALTDNISFPWFAVAGIQRGDVRAIKARKKLTLSDRDTLYDGRVNPIATFTTEGIKIFGNKTLQIKDTALNRINVRRLLLQARKLISAVSVRLLFEQNDDIVRNQFLSLVNPILDNIRAERGLTDFRVVLDDSPESIDRNELVGKIFLKPTRALEFIQLEFVIVNTGASFDDI